MDNQDSYKVFYHFYPILIKKHIIFKLESQIHWSLY